nr:DUF4251 domain-containing protein [uncultured Flavobacterium sp.]
MKTLVLSFFLSFSMLIGFGQEKSKQQIKEEQKQAKQKKVEALVDSKEFEFEGDMAYPQRGRSIDLTTNTNYLRFKNDSIHSEMPYFGRAYAGLVYGGGGLNFKGPIKDYSIAKNKKNFTIKGEVRDSSDSYQIILTIFFDGVASLTISSNNRDSITYRGDVKELKKNNCLIDSAG